MRFRFGSVLFGVYFLSVAVTMVSGDGNAEALHKAAACLRTAAHTKALISPLRITYVFLCICMCGHQCEIGFVEGHKYVK